MAAICAALRRFAPLSRDLSEKLLKNTISNMAKKQRN
ncbi:hypothetical protein O206_14900 [Ochrobactrum sp. EGD-AQ16]|nr:hypothetical protein O206_14900 [Ochrobactrum sp. EGD-AQ16]